MNNDPRWQPTNIIFFFPFEGCIPSNTKARCTEVRSCVMTNPSEFLKVVWPVGDHESDGLLRNWASSVLRIRWKNYSHAARGSTLCFYANKQEIDPLGEVSFASPSTRFGKESSECEPAYWGVAGKALFMGCFSPKIKEQSAYDGLWRQSPFGWPGRLQLPPKTRAFASNCLL